MPYADDADADADAGGDMPADTHAAKQHHAFVLRSIAQRAGLQQRLGSAVIP
jgi:hypothetical protein